MNRYVIVDGLPFLLANGKTYAVRWDDKGFTVGAEVKLASVPAVTHSEIAVKAKCATLDSIGSEQERVEEGNKEGSEQERVDFDGMKVAELKAYAEENGIELGEATKKADILAAIKAVGQDVNADDSDS